MVATFLFQLNKLLGPAEDLMRHMGQGNRRGCSVLLVGHHVMPSVLGSAGQIRCEICAPLLPDVLGNVSLESYIMSEEFGCLVQHLMGLEVFFECCDMMDRVDPNNGRKWGGIGGVNMWK